MISDKMTDYLDQLSDYLPLSPLATHIGLTCLAAQITFTLLFDRRTKLLPAGPWNHLTAYSAHQTVALPLMIILTYVGWRDWFFDPAKYDDSLTPRDRIFGLSNPNDVPLAIGSGAILLWDIPMGFLSPPLRDPIMWAHHVGMYLVAATMCGTFCKGGDMIGYYYGSFFFGVIELSSVFLAYVDLFHPKYKHYFEWLNSNHESKKSKSLAKILKGMNEFCRIFFALTFMAMRGLYFPYVTFFQAIPDLQVAYKDPPDGVPMWTGYFLAIMMASFACLQAYWGLLIVKQLKKALIGGSHGGGSKKKD